MLLRNKILLVDDDVDIGFTVDLTLGKSGYEIKHVKSGEECIELLEKADYKPDLILLDIMMPGMNGWEVYRKLKENPGWERIPIVFLTARVDRTAENAGSFLGDDYIEKPYDPEDLKRRIEKILSSK